MKNNLSRREFVEVALQYIGHSSTPFLGKEYAVGPNGDMSCSGFICFLADSLGLERPISKLSEMPIRTSREMYYFWGRPVCVEEAREGDLVFFSRSGMEVAHVGIYLANGQHIHSPGTREGRIAIASVKDYKLAPPSDGRYDGFDVVFEQNPVGFNRIF